MLAKNWIKYFLVMGLMLEPAGLCHASHYLEWGAGIANSTQTEYSQVKMIEGGYRDALSKKFDYQLGVGGFTDDSQYRGAQSSLYSEALVGLGPHFKSVDIEYYLGGAYISVPDTVLASNLQFAHEAILRLHDGRGVGMFISLKHLSNAGFVKPNIGRSFVSIGVEF